MRCLFCLLSRNLEGRHCYGLIINQFKFEAFFIAKKEVKMFGGFM